MLKEVQRRTVFGIRNMEKPKRKIIAPEERNARTDMISDSLRFKRFKF